MKLADIGQRVRPFKWFIKAMTHVDLTGKEATVTGHDSSAPEGTYYRLDWGDAALNAAVPSAQADAFSVKAEREKVISGAFTAKNWLIDKAPRLLRLFGDKAKKVESAQHIIEFPGGAVEVTRCTDGSYWCHIIVNQGQAIDDVQGRESAVGEVVGTRYELDGGSGVLEIPDGERLEHVAVLVRPRR